MQEKMLQIVSNTLDATKGLPPAKLRLLPGVEQLESGVAGVTLTRFRDDIGDGKLLLAVQAVRRKLGGLITEVEVRGFILCSDGSFENAPEERLWQFK